MAAKKIGRPTDNPKDIVIKIRLDKTTSEQLEFCSREIEVSKAEVVRRGVKKMFDDLENE